VAWWGVNIAGGLTHVERAVHHQTSYKGTHSYKHQDRMQTGPGGGGGRGERGVHLAASQETRKIATHGEGATEGGERFGAPNSTSRRPWGWAP
jgi:hypothetical protein